MYKGKTGEVRNLGIFEVTPMNNHINRDSSRRDLFINTVDDKIIRH